MLGPVLGPLLHRKHRGAGAGQGRELGKEGMQGQGLSSAQVWHGQGLSIAWDGMGRAGLQGHPQWVCDSRTLLSEPWGTGMAQEWHRRGLSHSCRE